MLSITPIRHVKPPIKWVGGKTSLLRHIVPRILSAGFSTYIEPFVGGGSVFIEIMNSLKYDKTVTDRRFIINDVNTDLINMYTMIKHDCDGLIQKLKTLECKNSKDEYFKLRDVYNKNKSVELFMYLNKTCFRGMYRVNKSGDFNVPYGNYKQLNFDYDNLMNLSLLMNRFNIEFMNRSYHELLTESVDSPDIMIYMDPPYFDTFDGYDKSCFDYMFFTDCLKRMADYKCKMLVSNSDKYETVVKEIGYKYELLECQDRINSKKPDSMRKEVLMTKI